MIIAYINAKPHQINKLNESLLTQATWIDMLSPSSIEQALVGHALGLNLPNHGKMHEIEYSSRLYKDNGTFFMTASMIAHTELSELNLDAITFILTQKQLITIRYIEPPAFKLFSSRLKKMESTQGANDFLIEILDATVDRLADILELIGLQLDESSQLIFDSNANDDSVKKLNHKKLLQKIGASGELNRKVRECLITLNRLITFFQQSINTKLQERLQNRFATLSKDINSLSHHADFISNKVIFLLDATLGMVNIEQNNTIKIVSVAAVIFLPPTLIASIYGMNFKCMPELSWQWGYPLAIALMLLAAWLPYNYFKRRNWL